MKLALATAALLPLHCGPIPPEQRAVPAGRYSYEVAVALPGAADSTHYIGTLIVDAATPASLGGRFEVPGLERTWRDGAFDVVSYRLVADVPGDSVALVHHLRPLGVGRAPRCTVAATRPGAYVEGRCTLRAVAP
jgi:hypothetical protein